jgi:hypothetical protein
MFNFSPAAIAMSALVLGVVLACSLIFAFRETLREFRLLFDLRVARTAFRSLIRFRLRTLLLLVAAIQFVTGIIVVLLGHDQSARDVAVYLGLGAFLFWFIQCAMADSIRPTASRRRHRNLIRHSQRDHEIQKADDPPAR